MGNEWLQGIFRPIPATFDKQGDLALPELRRNLEWGRGDLLHGFILLGSNGEAVHFSDEERRQLVSFVRETIPEDYRIIAGTGSFSTKHTTQLTQDAAAAGASAAMVLPPSYYRSQMSAAALQAHYYEVADDSPIPIVIYNVPNCTGIDLNAEMIAQLAEHENIIGLKASTGNVVKLATLRHTVEKDFRLIAGSAGFLLPALAVGADAAVLALANLEPDQCFELYQAAKDGDQDKAKELQLRLVELNTAVTARWGVPGLKEAMDQIGLYGGPVRRPLLSVGSDVRSALTDLLREAGLLPLDPKRGSAPRNE